MLFLLIALYVWAGATSVFALWLFERAGQAVNGLLPEEKHLKKNLSWGVMVLLFSLWPLILPSWVISEWRSNNRT